MYVCVHVYIGSQRGLTSGVSNSHFPHFFLKMCFIFSYLCVFVSDNGCVPMGSVVGRDQRPEVPVAEVTEGWELPDGMLGTELGFSTRAVYIISHRDSCLSVPFTSFYETASH